MDIRRMKRMKLATTENEAKFEAVREFMDKELRMKIDNDQIVKIFFPRKQGRETLYVEFASIDTVREIFHRLTRLKRNSIIQVVNFIPTIIWDRYKKAEETLYEERGGDKDIKTKIVLGVKDIIMLRKKRGETEYRKIDMRERESMNLPPVNWEKKRTWAT